METTNTPVAPEPSETSVTDPQMESGSVEEGGETQREATSAQDTLEETQATDAAVSESPTEEAPVAEKEETGEDSVEEDEGIKAAEGEEAGEGEPAPHPMEALTEEDFQLRQFRRGQMIRGTIIAKTKDEIIVDIGGKSEGIVPPHDLSRLDEEFLDQLSEGDEIVAYVLTPEGREGQVVLSLSKARSEYEWERMARLQEENATVEAKVVEANRGGVVVQVGHLRGFVPASHIVPRPETRDADSPENRFMPLVGQTLQAKILEVNRKRQRLILSEKEADKEAREARKRELLKELRQGEVRRGRVTSLTKFGAFVDLGGVDGLIHISELSWGRVEHPSEVLKVGDEVDVLILDVDEERERVSLSLRRLLPKPWETVLERYAIGQVVEGIVTRVVPFGAFVRLDDGIEGLVHISELANRFVNHPHEVVKEGDRVQVRILNIDPENRRMGLSIRQVDEDEYVEVDWEVADDEDIGEESGTWEALSSVLTDEASEFGEAQVPEESGAESTADVEEEIPSGGDPEEPSTT